ncbi:ROK family transcriptional regulator [Chitinophaga lutea]|uniref:ROK family transcriptional regulator n=1 Tax=Chitinophaga lutea TaxID=2488634 RepID=A0A3N4PML0_9BACT|nr:ROK family transcriptional regulator [Chitinophaga lutea]RPE09035.1 ROK family transcriptional regulator [Chitinophaga lutea]
MFSKSDLYKRRILKELCFGNALSGTEISSRIEKSLPLTVRILGELVKEGLVEEKGYAPSSGGRRPQVYALKPEKMYVVSVAMDQLVTRIAIIDMQNCDIICTEKIGLPLPKNPDALGVLANQLNHFIDNSTIARDKIIGMGIGMPGFVDVSKGINYSFLKTPTSIVDFLQNRVGIPVYIDNDSSLIALAEFRLGAARGRSDVMVININWGIGLGLILNGELFRGCTGFAGEFSHIPIFVNNKLCSCGKSGCLETEASMLVVIERAVEGLKSGRVSTIEEMPEDFEEACNTIISAATHGDTFAVELLSEAAYNIGRGIAILIHILNPELIILSGRGAAAGKLWLAPVQQAVNSYCIPRLASQSELAVSTLNNRAELIGAAALVIENYDKKPAKNKGDRVLA